MHGESPGKLTSAINEIVLARVGKLGLGTKKVVEDITLLKHNAHTTTYFLMLG